MIVAWQLGQSSIGLVGGIQENLLFRQAILDLLFLVAHPPKSVQSSMVVMSVNIVVFIGLLYENSNTSIECFS